MGEDMKHSVTNTPLRFTIIALLVVAFSFSSVLAQDASEGLDKANQAKESFNQAIEYAKNGDTTTAISMYKGAIDLDETLGDAHLNLGSLYFAQKKYRDAEATFQKYTELNPSDPIGFSNLGKVYAAQKKNTEAQAAYEGALTADPDYSEANKELGKIYYSMGKDDKTKYDDCIVALEKYTAKVTNDHYAFYMIGAAYDKNKDYNKAIAAYKSAIGVKANHFESLRNLGRAYVKKENYTQGISYFRQALKIKPKDYKTAYNLAIAVQSANPDNYDTVISQWESFVKMASKNPRAKTQVKNANAVLKQLREAKVVADEEG